MDCAEWPGQCLRAASRPPDKVTPQPPTIVSKPRGKSSNSFPDMCSLRSAHDPSSASGTPNAMFSRIVLAEEKRLLRRDGQVRRQDREQLFGQDDRQPAPSQGDIVKSSDQVDECGFARTCWPNNH